VAPSQTSAGIRWLGNFDESERPTATLLLDALRIVNSSTIRAALQDEIASASYDRPAAFYPIRALDDFTDADWPVAFVDFDPSWSIPAAPGSEALTANLLRNLARGRSDVLGPDSDLDRLRSARCRSIVFVEDYAGSGDQCLEYADSWFANRTIRSWQSFGWVRIHVLLFAASPEAKVRICRDKRFSSVKIIEQAPSLSYAGWSPQKGRRPPVSPGSRSCRTAKYRPTC